MINHGQNSPFFEAGIGGMKVGLRMLSKEFLFHAFINETISILLTSTHINYCELRTAAEGYNCIKKRILQRRAAYLNHHKIALLRCRDHLLVLWNKIPCELAM